MFLRNESQGLAGGVPVGPAGMQTLLYPVFACILPLYERTSTTILPSRTTTIKAIGHR